MRSILALTTTATAQASIEATRARSRVLILTLYSDNLLLIPFLECGISGDLILIEHICEAYTRIRSKQWARKRHVPRLSETTTTDLPIVRGVEIP